MGQHHPNTMDTRVTSPRYNVLCLGCIHGWYVKNKYPQILVPYRYQKKNQNSLTQGVFGMGWGRYTMVMGQTIPAARCVWGALAALCAALQTASLVTLGLEYWTRHVASIFNRQTQEGPVVEVFSWNEPLLLRLSTTQYGCMYWRNVRSVWHKHCKVLEPFLVTLPNQTAKFEWYMARLVVKKWTPKRHMLQWDWTMDTILWSFVNTIGRAYANT